MALDSQLTQNINLRANGDALLRPLTAMGNQLNRLVQQMQQVANPSTAKGRKEIEQLTGAANKALGTIKTINDLINNGSRTGRSKNALLGGLTEQSFGKTVLNASKLRTELEGTTKASDALEVRLSQLYKKFNDLGNAGKAIGQRDIAKALNTQEAIKQVQNLEREISRLDARNNARGGLTGEAATTRSQLGTAYDTLLARAQNGRRVDWSKEIAEVQVLADGYKTVTRDIEMTATAAQRAASQRRSAIMDTINMNEAQLRASINRQSGGFNFTQDQARQSNIPQLNAQVEQGIQRLQTYQQVMSRAVAAGKSQEVIDRLAGSFGNLKGRVAEATAQVKAFGSLPEQKMKGMTDMLFSNGGAGAFAKRIIGAGAISYAGFAALNAATSSASYMVQLDDAMAKLQAIAGATDPEMQKLSKSIFDVAENSRYSTLEITQAATQIAQAGYAADDADKVLRASLMLATGSGSSVSEAVDAMTSALGAFNLQASESPRIMDVLMTALNDSKLSMTQMQAAMQYAGATAHEAGMSIEELATFSEMAANAGIKSGSTIGTGMRQLIIDLQEPTDKFKKQLDALGLTMADVDVKSQGLDGVIRKLTQSGFTAQAAYASFETRAAAFFLALKGQMDTYDQLSQSITQTGAAAAAQERAMNSLSAQWQKFLNLLTEIAAGLTGPIKVALQGTLEIVNAVAGALVSFAGSAVRTDEAGQAMAGTFNVLIGILGGFFLGGPWGAVIGGLVSFVGVMNNASDSTEALEAKTSEAKATLTAQKQTVSSVDEAIQRLIDRHGTLKDHSVALQVETQTLTQRFEGLSVELQGAALNYDNLLSAMLRYRGAQLRDAAVKADAVRQSAKEQGGAGVQQLQQNQGSLQGMFNHSYGNYKGTLGQVAHYVQGTEGKLPYGDMNTEQLLVEGTNVQAMITALKREKNQNDFTKNLIDLLQQRLELLNTVKKARSDITATEQQIGLYKEQTNNGGQIRDSYVRDATIGIGKGLDENKAKPGSGDLDLTKSVNLAKARIDQLTKQLSALDPASAKAMAIQNSIDQLNAQVARVASEAALAGGGKSDHAKPGQTLTAAQVKAELLKAFPGIKVGSAEIRKPGDPAYTPGTLHGMGRALDIQGLPPGVTADNILAFIESLGLTIAPGHNGFWDETTRPSTAKTWTGPHIHVGWQAKQSQASRLATRADTHEENVTQKLVEQGDQLVLDTISKNIQTTLDEAKNGTKSPVDLSKSLDDQVAAYQAAALKKFDDANPTKDLTPDQLKLRAADRQKVIDDVAAKAADWHAKLWKQIEDHTEKMLDATLDALKNALADANNKIDETIGNQQSRVDAVTNRHNRDQFGAGVAYRENRKLEDAQNQGNLDKLTNQQTFTTGMGSLVNQQQSLVNQLYNPNSEQQSEAYLDAQKKLLDYQKQYNDSLHQTVQLQETVDAQQMKLADVPLKQRLQDSAQAWLENSGAMDSWKKQVENNVGPALDTLTSGFSQFFTDILSGSKSFKSALGDMLKTFAMFVIQMITKALALMAVKAILQAMGLKMPEGMFGGGETGKLPTVDYTKVPVHIPGRLGGGISHLPGGGSITNGVSNRDSSLYNLAAGEYVIRNKSVRDLGLPFMDAINKHGAKGLAKMGAAGGIMQNFQMPKQETNVFVVKPDSQPPMGKNDILVTVHEDILQGGATKKLIKHVAQGG